MRSATVLVALSTFTTSALAQVAGFAVFSAPTDGEVVPAGKPYTVKWAAGKYKGPITLSVVGGDAPDSLQPLETLAEGLEVTTNTFKWAVDCSLKVSKTYGLKIVSDTDPDLLQWSFPFKLDYSGCDTTSAPSTPSATPSASSYTTTPATPTKSSTTEKSVSTPTSYPASSQTSTVVATSSHGSTTTTLATTTAPPATQSTGTSTTPTTSVTTAAATKLAGPIALAGMAVAAALAL